jgi:hypothetical protein
MSYTEHQDEREAHDDLTPILTPFIQALSPQEQEFIATYNLYAPDWEKRVPAGLAPQAIAFCLQWKASRYLSHPHGDEDQVRLNILEKRNRK